MCKAPPSVAKFLRYKLSGPEVMRFAKIRIEFYRFVSPGCHGSAQHSLNSLNTVDLEKNTINQIQWNSDRSGTKKKFAF